MKPAWSIVEYKGHDGLRRLEEDWKRLLTAMPDRGFHHAYETHVAYFNHMPFPHGPFTFLALTDGARVRAICPLEPDVMQILGSPTRVWGLPLGRQHFPRDVICPPDEARRELLPCLVRFLRRSPGRPSWLVFDRVLAGSAAWQCLDSLDSRVFCTDVVGGTSVFDCERPFEELAAALPRKHRHNLRSAHKKLAALADVRFVTVSDSASLPRQLETFLDLEASGWKGEVGTTVRQRPAHLAVYRELVAMLSDDGRCEIDALYAEGRCIGSQVCFRTGAECASPKIAYDEQYARVGPGHLLVERALERCCRDPEIKRFSAVANAEWLRPWRPEVIPRHSVYIALGRWSGPPLMSLLRLRFRHGPRVKGWLLRSRSGSRMARWLGSSPRT